MKATKKEKKNLKFNSLKKEKEVLNEYFLTLISRNVIISTSKADERNSRKAFISLG